MISPIFILSPPFGSRFTHQEPTFDLVEDMRRLVERFAWERLYNDMNIRTYLLDLQLTIDGLFVYYMEHKPSIIRDKHPTYFIRVTDYSTPHFIVVLRWEELDGWMDKEERFYSNPDAIKAKEELVWID